LVSVLTGCLFLLIRHENLQQLGMSVFSGLLVLLPALIGVLFWPNANRLGCLVSLIVGMLAWIVLQVLPFSFSQLPKHAIVLWLMQFEQEWLGLLTFFVATAGLVIGSMLSKQSGTEHSRALECAVYDPEPILRIQRWDISATCVGEMEHALSQQLGRRIALQQLRLALNHLGLSRQEQRPHQLTRLREQLNFNLSALLGPAAAQDMLDRALPYQARIDLPKIVMRHSLEQRLDQTPDHSMLSGAAAELDALRRFHRQTLHELPIGVCSVDQHLTLMGWNRVMSDMTGFGDEVIGWRLGDLPAPWGPVRARSAPVHPSRSRPTGTPPRHSIRRSWRTMGSPKRRWRLCPHRTRPRPQWPVSVTSTVGRLRRFNWPERAGARPIPFFQSSRKEPLSERS